MSAFGTNNTSGSSSSTGLFGGKPATGGGLFGAPAATPATGGTSGSQGGVAPTGTTGTFAPPSTSLFGSTSNAATPAASANIFGSKSPAPASTTSSGTGAFGMANATTTGSTSTGVFGASSTATPASTTPVTTTNPLFGGSSKLADANATNMAKPAGTGSFGQPSTSAGTTATTNAPSAGSFFSQPPKPDAASSTATAAPTAASSNLFGGGLFGAKSPVTQATTASTPALSIPTPTASAKDFFAKPPEPQKDSASAPIPAAPTTGGLFGAKSADPKDASATSTTPLGGFLGKPVEKKDGSGPTSAALATTTTTSCGQTSTGLSVAVAPPSTLKGKTIEEIVNKWSSDLETHVREFNKFATEVAVWDRTLIDNSNTLNTLYSHVEAAEREQNDIDQSLDHIEQQQNELASTLAAYEKVAQEILGSQGSMRALDTGPADTERDKNYMLAADLHTHLDDLSGSLTQMIDSVNALSLPSIDSSPAEDPMSQIAQILSSHLESLQWIDSAVCDVESKITEVEQRVKDNGHTLPSSVQKSSGRTFGLTR